MEWWAELVENMVGLDEGLELCGGKRCAIVGYQNDWQTVCTETNPQLLDGRCRGRCGADVNIAPLRIRVNYYE